MNKNADGSKQPLVFVIGAPGAMDLADVRRSVGSGYQVGGVRHISGVLELLHLPTVRVDMFIIGPDWDPIDAERFSTIIKDSSPETSVVWVLGDGWQGDLAAMMERTGIVEVVGPGGTTTTLDDAVQRALADASERGPRIPQGIE